MKIGVILILTIGIIIVMPNIQMPAVTEYVNGGGPIIPGKVFPYLFITIACGALSGFHSLVSSGTTPKLINNEKDILPIGFGAMLVEAFVGVMALIAATVLPTADYFAINTLPGIFEKLNMNPADLPLLSSLVGEELAGRPGGSVSLAVGMTYVFHDIPWLEKLMGVWYHFCIMFEALFILTAIDAGTRIGRFMLQEALGRIYQPFGRAGWLPGNLLASGIIVFSWAYFIYSGTISTIWPMFGSANQLLATIALAAGTSYIINQGKIRYAWITLVPMLFVGVTTLTAGWQNITGIYLPQAFDPQTRTQGIINSLLTVIIVVCVLIILSEAIPKWIKAWLTDHPHVTL